MSINPGFVRELDKMLFFRILSAMLMPNRRFFSWFSFVLLSALLSVVVGGCNDDVDSGPDALDELVFLEPAFGQLSPTSGVEVVLEVGPDLDVGTLGVELDGDLLDPSLFTFEPAGEGAPPGTQLAMAVLNDLEVGPHELEAVAFTGVDPGAMESLTLTDFVVPSRMPLAHCMKLGTESLKYLDASFDQALAMKIEQSPRRCDQHVHSASQCRNLGLLADTTEDDRGFELGVVAVLLETFVDLGSQLARWCQDQGTECRLMLPGLTLRRWRAELMEDWKGKRGRLAGTGLGTSQDILAVHHHRNGLGLDRGRGGVSLAMQCTTQRFSQVQIIKRWGGFAQAVQTF